MTREQYINHKTASREVREAQKEFFGMNNLSFDSVKDANDKMAKCVDWYNTKRKLKTTGLTPKAMHDKGVRSALIHPIEQAYGLVFDAMDQLDKRTEKGDTGGSALVKKALELDPENEEALFILCDLLLTGETPLDAAPYVDRLLEVEPNSTEVHLWKAQILVLKDGGMGGPNLKKAAGFVAEAHSLDPENFDVAAFCAQLSYWLDDPKHELHVGAMHKIDRKRAERFMSEHFIFTMPGKGRKAGRSSR